MTQRHKHADLIIAWANGATIQYEDSTGWVDIGPPVWGWSGKYRVKPGTHKWQKEMDAQAEGKTIQIRSAPDEEWRDANCHLYFADATTEYRVKPEPDPFAELKAALAAGKKIEIKSAITGDWLPMYSTPRWNEEPSQYRVKPEEPAPKTDAEYHADKIEEALRKHFHLDVVVGPVQGFHGFDREIKVGLFRNGNPDPVLSTTDTI